MKIHYLEMNIHNLEINIHHLFVNLATFLRISQDFYE